MDKPLVVASKENPASRNILQSLLRLHPMSREAEGIWTSDEFDIEEASGSIVEIIPQRDAGYFIYASTHKSASKQPNFTAHTPGNWGDAGLGGSPRTLNMAYGSKIRAAALEMQKLSAQTLGWQISIEADHHGPTLDRPVLFVEIGSCEEQWGVPEAGEIAAKGILAAIMAPEEKSVMIGFGGGHYCPKFLPMALAGGKAFGHIISGYSLEGDGMDEERIMQAFGKNVEEVECAAIDWKGIKGGRRSELVAALDALGIKWVKV